MTEILQQKPVRERLCILVVEDSDLLREMFHQAFHDVHSLYMASNLKEGWKLFLDKTPHIVFLDIGLPDGNGHDLARIIKEQDPNTYIIMATASHYVEDKKEAVQNHVDGFIVKPFDKKKINDYIDQYLTTRYRKA